MKLTKKATSKEERAEIKKAYGSRGYNPTGEVIAVDWRDEENAVGCVYCEYVVFKGSWTRYDTIRDCGDHYIWARYSRYDRIDKETLQVTKDVEDI